MNTCPWVAKWPNSADFHNARIVQQPNDMKRHLMSSRGPVINLASLARTATPLLPPIGSISPAHTTSASRLSIGGRGNLLNPLKLEYCLFEGCANFSKMQGFCHDHIYGRPAPQFSSPNQTQFVQTTTNPLPSLVHPSPNPQQQYLPALNDGMPTHSQDLQPVSALAYPYDSSVQPSNTTTAVAYNQQSPIFMRHMTHLSQNKTSRPSSICSFNFGNQCRRDGCRNEARRKGLCMEHGGRHFCKKAGCHKCAHRGGFCISHGGGRRCAVKNCSKSAQSGGICYSHGGGKRCATEGCTHAARSGGFCIKHGKLQQALQHQYRQH